MNKKTIEHIKRLDEKYNNIDIYSKLFHSAKKTGNKIYEVQGIDDKKIEIYPPKIGFIQYAEPQVLISNYYYTHFPWYHLRSLIKPFAEEGFLAYYKGMYLSSISCIATCCEYVLKFELFKKTNFNPDLTLGSFVSKNYEEIKMFVENIEIKDFELKIFKVNQIRNGYFHFNTKKLFNINNNSLPVSQEFDMIKITKEIYEILNEILEYFYNRPEKEIVLECLTDFKLRKKEVLEKLFKDKGPSGFGEGQYKSKFEHYKKEYNLNIEYD